MKSLIRSLAILTVASSAAFASNTYNVFTDLNGAINFFQPDGTTKLTGAYFFEVGAIAVNSAAFTSAAQVSAAFTPFSTTGNGEATNWNLDVFGDGSNVAGASVSSAFDETTLYPAGTAGKQLAIWVYDSKANAGTSDWVVLTNPAWLVQTAVFGAAVDSRDYTITDAGTVALYGSFVGTKVTTAPVPEPSTYAAVAGLAVLGVVASRRRRAA